jgi:hypothetical protein
VTSLAFEGKLRREIGWCTGLGFGGEVVDQALDDGAFVGARGTEL